MRRYIKWVLPDKHTILGLTLKDYCLGHQILLEKCECIYASDDSSSITDIAYWGIDELLTALIICSRSYEDCLEFLNTPSRSISDWCLDFITHPFSTLRELFHPTDFRRWVKKWKRQLVEECRKDDSTLPSAFAAFEKYLEQSKESPEVRDNRPSTTVSQFTKGLHEYQTLMKTLCGVYGYSECHILNMPLAQAKADYYKHCDDNKSLDLLSDEEIAMYEQIRKIREEMEKAKCQLQT